mmetsp:Transcript_24744/g.86145  ORF Transcript_24744/g.86145 Transcript_24744/m.86145 type:complete len:205 (+) Transcript_24744:280-894(+)
MAWWCRPHVSLSPMPANKDAAASSDVALAAPRIAGNNVAPVTRLRLAPKTPRFAARAMCCSTSKHSPQLSKSHRTQRYLRPSASPQLSHVYPPCWFGRRVSTCGCSDVRARSGRRVASRRRHFPQQLHSSFPEAQRHRCSAASSWQTAHVKAPSAACRAWSWWWCKYSAACTVAGAGSDPSANVLCSSASKHRPQRSKSSGTQR